MNVMNTVILSVLAMVLLLLLLLKWTQMVVASH